MSGAMEFAVVPPRSPGQTYFFHYGPLEKLVNYKIKQVAGVYGSGATGPHARVGTYRLEKPRCHRLICQVIESFAVPLTSPLVFSRTQQLLMADCAR